MTSFGPLLTSLRFKDCDVTWLYGPLQTGTDWTFRKPPDSESCSVSTTKSAISLETKSILKKRGLSELMLQRSLSSSSLLKRAVAAVEARHSSACAYPRLGWPVEIAVNLSPRSGSAHYPSLRSSISSPGIQSPADRKCVRFDEQVGQCMALGTKGLGEGVDNGKKTITPLPSTTLSDMEDIPKPRETSTVSCNGFCSGGLRS